MFADNRLSDIVASLMLELPDTILELPASTTGKYHPGDEIDKSGMTIHIKRACALVEDATRKYNFTRYGHDVLLAGCLLHDIFKDGDPPTGHTVTEHPYLVWHDLISRISGGINYDLDFCFISDVAKACAWHEGIWTTELCRDIEETLFAKALHEIDFWVTRRTMWEIMKPEWVKENS
jgi:hypothetical protein